MSDTPRTDAARDYTAPEKMHALCEELERENAQLLAALDTLTLVVGLTPIAGNKEALQEAVDMARAAIADHLTRVVN